MDPIASQETSAIATLLETWSYLPQDEKLPLFRSLDQDDAEDLFLSMGAHDQGLLFNEFSRGERRLWIRFLPPDDAADVLQEVEDDLKGELLHMIDDVTRREIQALLSYREDEAGGLMSPRFVRVRSDMLVTEAIRYVRRQAESMTDAVHYVYVLAPDNLLLGVMSLRELFIAPNDKRVTETMHESLVTVPEDMDQEAVSRLFKQHRFVALPVTDKEGRMKGIVTLDDILDVSQEEATEDIQKLGGMESLDAPYPQVSLGQMIRKRAGWLTLLFIGEMFTATAMSHYEDEVAKAVVLSLFLPLIISSGGNSGSQATSLIIRAMALQEIRLRDWLWVLGREVVTGLALGAILACIGFTRICIWPHHEDLYTKHYLLVAATVASSLIGVVLFGSVIGSMLPFLLRSLRMDPASASAPMVATLVDVTGLVIYFTVAQVILSGVLL